MCGIKSTFKKTAYSERLRIKRSIDKHRFKQLVKPTAYFNKPCFILEVSNDLNALQVFRLINAICYLVNQNNIGLSIDQSYHISHHSMR